MIVLLLVLILINGALAMTELAVVSARQARLAAAAAAGDATAAAALKLARAPSRFLATVQIGITLVGVLLGAAGQAGLVSPLAEALAEFPPLTTHARAIAGTVVVVVITYLSLVLGELVPKRLAMRWPERIAQLMARPMGLLASLSAPLVWLLSASTDLVTRLLGVRPGGEEPVSDDEIRALAEQGVRTGMLKPAESALLGRVFRLDERPVAQLMTPRQAVVWLDLGDEPVTWRATLTDHAYSYYPVGDGTLDQPVGMVKAKDALATPGALTAETLRACLREPLLVPEGMTALALLEQFRREQARQALVLDEHGGVEGLVTLHDIVEVMVGQMPDEAGGDEASVVTRHDGSWLVDGRLAVDELKALLAVDALPGEPRYHTAAGFVLHVVGTVPPKGAVFEWGAHRFEVVDLDGRRVDQLLVTRLDAPAADGSPD